MRRIWLLAAFLALAMALETSRASRAAAGPAHLVVDLNPGDSRVSTFAGFTRLGDRVLFTGSEDEIHCLLWSTDGTAAGTERVADLCADAVRSDFWLPTRILAATARVAFLADPSGQLWRSDGTADGTFPLGVVVSSFADPLPGPGGILYFAVCTPANDCVPWRSDGTPAGTGMLRVPAGTRLSPLQLVVAGDRVVFGITGKKGPALWSTDGTPRGTQELVRLPSRAGQLQAVDGALYVSASDSESSVVWVVPAGGRTLRRLGTFPSHHRTGVDLVKAGGRLLLAAHEEDGLVDLWEITPPRYRPRFLVQFEGGLGPIAAAGGGLVLAASADYETRILSLWFLGPGMRRPQPVSGCPGGCPEVDPFPAQLGIQGDRLLFAGRDAQHGGELWETDGTGPGTRRVRELCPGVCDGFHGGFTPALGRLLFTAGEEGSPGDLWVTDGTAAGTLPLGRTLAASPLGPELAAVNGRVIFSGFDEVEGSQPWVSDLTMAGTMPLGSGFAAGSAVQNPAPSGSGVLFGACDPDGLGVWHSDGTAAGTVRLLSSGKSCSSTNLSPFVQSTGLSFFGFDGPRLWRSDGTPAGSLLLASWDTPLPFLRGYAAVAGGLLFVVDPDVFEDPADFPLRWLFGRSDGTPQGTVQTGAVPLGGTPYVLGGVGNDVFFAAQRSEEPFSFTLFRSDGTEAGTRELRGISDQVYPPAELARLGGTTFFVLAGADRPAELELWSSDGTAAGTVPVIADPAAPRPLDPRSLTVFHGALYFYAGTGDPARPRALWRSDGTAAGTRVVAAFPPPGDPVLPAAPQLTAAGDLLFFRLDDGIHGEELWRTDGTAAGTFLVRDLAPGPAHSRPGFLTAAGGRLYFAATDGEHGLELWSSDGTAAGTEMVQDVLPGRDSSWPQDLVAAGGNLFFTADDGEHGRELWVLPLADGAAQQILARP